MTSTSYFEEQWAGSDDPWDHAGRWYEARKYDLTVAAAPAERYERTVEPACGAGVLTRRLAGRADVVDASDRFDRSVAATRARCADLTNVTVAVADIRDGPRGPADLVVLGEVLYYFDEATVHDVTLAWWSSCSAGGHLVAVHYRGPVGEHELLGDAVHSIVRDALGSPVVSVVDELFLIDVFAR